MPVTTSYPSSLTPLSLPAVRLPVGMSDHEGVYQRLRAAIMAGHFAPATPLTLQGLSDALSCSQTPVREAVRRLSSEHAIEVQENRRMRIPAMTAPRFEELLSLRITVEGHAARRALPYVSDMDIADLADLDGAVDAALAAGDHTAMTATNQAFHRRLYCANPHQTTQPVIDSIWLQLGPFQRQVIGRGLPYYVQDRHRQILDALRQRDAAALDQAIVADITDGIATSGRQFLAQIAKGSAG